MNIALAGGRFLQGILFFIHIYIVKHGENQKLARKECHIEMEIRPFERQGLVLKSEALSVCVCVFCQSRKKQNEDLPTTILSLIEEGKAIHGKKEKERMCLLIIPLHK